MVDITYLCVGICLDILKTTLQLIWKKIFRTDWTPFKKSAIESNQKHVRNSK